MRNVEFRLGETWGCLLLIFLLLLSGCHKDVATSEETEVFSDIVRLPTTPVKQQGHSESCWIYAMLATVETDRLVMGDSVNLSADYLCRQYLSEQALHYYLSRGRKPISMRGMMPMTLRLLEQYGAEPFDTYHGPSSLNYHVLCRKVEQAARTSKSFAQLARHTDALFDSELGFLPRFVFMAGVEYTPQQFGRSVCRPEEYVALTSFTHHGFQEDVVLEFPDNREQCRFRNVPIDELMAAVDSTLLSGHAVCWEGDISNKAFDFKKGVARLTLDSDDDVQQLRQQSFERLGTTDDHCLTLVGIAEDSNGERFYLAKNSWGTENAYGGFVYLSVDYVRLFTIAVVGQMRNRRSAAEGKVNEK